MPRSYARFTLLSITAILPSLTACRSGSSNDGSQLPADEILQPSAGSGTIAMDLEGVWEIVDGDLDASEPMANTWVQLFEGFTPPRLGAQLEIADGRIVSIGTRSADRADRQPETVEAYVNEASDRFAYFALRRRELFGGFTEQGLYWTQLTLGTIEPIDGLERMIGEVRFVSQSHNLTFLPNQGQHTFVLARVR